LEIPAIVSMRMRCLLHIAWQMDALVFSIVMVFHQTLIVGSSTTSWCNIVTLAPGIPPTFHNPHFTLGRMITSSYHPYGMQSSQTRRQIIKHAFINWFYRICILDWESIYKQPS
jgi:hypothetical protein